MYSGHYTFSEWSMIGPFEFFKIKNLYLLVDIVLDHEKKRILFIPEDPLEISARYTH